MARRARIVGIVVGVLVVLGLIFMLARGIVANSYSSEEELIEREMAELGEDAPEVELDDSVGNHGFASEEELYERARELDCPVYIARIDYLLSREGSPFTGRDYSYTEYDLDNGEKCVEMVFEKEVLMVYCNSLDYSAYMFVKDAPFSREEDEYFSNMGVGTTGREGGRFYWVFG